MSARSPRRSFAAPFVVTLVPSLATACYVETTPAPAGPSPAPVMPAGATSPEPAPPAASTAPAPLAPPPVIVANPPRPAPQQPPPVVVANPPRPAPPPAPQPTTSKHDVHWTIKKSNGACTAWLSPNCPGAKPGEPQLACNPPPPKKVACPDLVQEGGSIQIVRYAGRTDCLVDWGPITCPKNATCNPPPPRKVACP
ncbi:MAG: hypothetical protein AB7P03_11125 [Kofleriaceae bacterium]